MSQRKPGEVSLLPCHDYERRTCIQVERADDVVKFIPLDIVAGLQVREMAAKEFDQWFKPMVNYPAEKACQLYLSYARTIGASEEALHHLARVITIPKQEFEMVVKKKTVADSQAAEKASAKEKAVKEKSAKAPAKAAVAKAPAKAAAKAATAKAPAKARTAKANQGGEKKPTAAQMFQDLIMAGKLTDDEIFAKVQEEFGLDEKKRGYTKWYRNHLKKQGKNPPEARS